MFFGLTPEKLLILGILAAFLIGPERLPRYAEALARFAGRAREFLRGAQDRVRDEMGPEFTDVDWRKLDPRQYDPRRIIREALLDDAPLAPVKPVSPGGPGETAASGAAGAAAGGAGTTTTSAPSVTSPRLSPLGRVSFSADDPPPFDMEAT